MCSWIERWDGFSYPNNNIFLFLFIFFELASLCMALCPGVLYITYMQKKEKSSIKFKPFDDTLYIS